MLGLSLGGIVGCKKEHGSSYFIFKRGHNEETASVIQETVQIGHLDLELPRFRTVSNKLLLFMGHLVGRVPAQVSEQTESSKSASYFLLLQAQTATSCPLSIYC